MLNKQTHKFKNKITRSALTALTLALAACSTPPLSIPWNVGKFQGSLADSETTSEFTVTCTKTDICALSIRQTRPKSGAAPITSTTQPSQYSVEIPNNNLEHTRKAISADPSLYSDGQNGQLLRAIRPLLGSEATFEQCIDVGVDRYSQILCSISDDKAATKQVILLLATMNGTCSGQPFCAYFFMLLNRQS